MLKFQPTCMGLCKLRGVVMLLLRVLKSRSLCKVVSDIGDGGLLIRVLVYGLCVKWYSPD